MELHRPFRVITPSVDGDVLTVLARADTVFTPPQIHRLLGARSEAGIRRSLNRLSEQGIVDAERVGQAVTYRLNRRHLAAEAVTTIADLMSLFRERTTSLIETWSIPPLYAALFGSAARGTMQPASDIDLFLVRQASVDADDAVWRAQLDRLADEVTHWTGNDARILEYSEDDVAAGRRDHEQVLQEIQRDGVRLFGVASFEHLRTGDAP